MYKMIESKANPPLQHHYRALVQKSAELARHTHRPVIIKECEVPVIDLDGLESCVEGERQACCAAICKAASEWGFFQVVNHGISRELLRRMRREEVKLFDMPFEKKATCGLLNHSYRWGTPTATRPSHFSWSEAFHIPFTNISQPPCCPDFTSSRYQLL